MYLEPFKEGVDLRVAPTGKFDRNSRDIVQESVCGESSCEFGGYEGGSEEG